MAHHGQSLVRIHVRVAMTGEVLAHRHHAALLQSAHVCLYLVGHLCGILAERTHMNDRIGRIGADIGHRRKVDLHAQLAKLARHLTSVCLDKRIVGDAAQCRILRKVGHVGQAHGQSPLAVERNH